MANGKCDKCRKETRNEPTPFLTGMGGVDYSTKDNKFVTTSTAAYSTRSCTLCDDCIGQYVEDLKRGKTSYAPPIVGLVLSTIIGLIFILPTKGTVFHYIAILCMVVSWGLMVRAIIERRKAALEKSEEVKAVIAKASGNDSVLKYYELDAKTDYLKTTNQAVWPIIMIGGHPYAQGRMDLGPLDSPFFGKG